MEQFVRRWKDEAGISERRRRDDKLDDYLTVWDLREGWVEGRYDSSREQTLHQIAQQQRVPLSTVANRYRSAFRLIVGREYSPALWARVLGFLKVSELLDPEELPQRTLRRPWHDRRPRLVPEAALRAPEEVEGSSSLVNTSGVSANEIAYVDLILDIQDLIAKGRSNENIVAELELTSPFSGDIIDFLRERRRDLPQ
jgi:hypothetical protein